MDHALDRLEAHIQEHGPYDVLCGFSQGSIMVTMLTARALRRARGGEGPPPSWRLNLIISGLPPRCPAQPAPTPFTVTSESRLDFPAVAIMGEHDDLLPWGERIGEIYTGLHWMTHPGGHEVPKDAEVTKKLAEAIWHKLGFVEGKPVWD